MTTIKSVAGLSELAITDTKDGNHAVVFQQFGATAAQYGQFPTTDLLAALDAVPRVPEQPPLADRERDLLGPQNDDGRYWHGRAMENLRKAELATTRAENAEAERDAHAAVIGRVREIAESSYNSSWLALKGIRAALDPKPAFVLPTEPGVRFEATDNLGHEVTFRAVWSGPHIMYLNESTSVIWNRDNLLAGCTDFRLLGADE